ncbi:TetR/AcrR family transcriptional regulator [Actinomyces sp. W5033]|uniref:TetR/AcrR family transcriptional regulator n=1 Tax=Actinomyces sp. W5033 TaxID=3446479 RepID=UPI003EE1D005
MPHLTRRRPSLAETRLRKRENTRARLIDAAADVIISKGLGAARIDDVVSAAGFTRGAFYSNFSSLDEVLVEALRTHSARLLVSIRAALDDLPETISIDAIMDLLDAVRPEVRALYILSSEQSLHLMRHPEERGEADGAHQQAPAGVRQEFTAVVGGLIEEILARLGRTPLLPAEVITDIVAMFFLDSIRAEAVGETRGVGGGPEGYLRLSVEVVLARLTAPAGAEAPPPASPPPPPTPRFARERTA